MLRIPCSSTPPVLLDALVERPCGHQPLVLHHAGTGECPVRQLGQSESNSSRTSARVRPTSCRPQRRPVEIGFGAGGNVDISSPIGGGWYILPSNGIPVPIRRFLAQATTDGDLSGQFYIQIFPNGDQSLLIENTFGFQTVPGAAPGVPTATPATMTTRPPRMTAPAPACSRQPRLRRQLPDHADHVHRGHVLQRRDLLLRARDRPLVRLVRCRGLQHPVR